MIASEEIVDQSYAWLCEQRKHFPANADIWHFRHHWLTKRPEIIKQLLNGRYQFNPQQRVTLSSGKTIHLWGAQDALVQKAMSLVLAERWAISPRCTHIKGNGGTKGALRWLQKKLPNYSYVFRSDVKGYYENINHTVLIEQCEQLGTDKDVLRLLAQLMRRPLEWGGTFKTINKGISRGSPMSPLLAAIYLKPLDDAMDKAQIAYVRYMDDWLILTTNRHKLRQGIALVNQVLNQLKVHQHPDKTWMGNIDRGFDFLGYHHTRAGLKPAKDTIQRFRKRHSQLYEQGADNIRIGAYQTRWWRWVCAGLAEHLVLIEQSSFTEPLDWLLQYQ